MTYLTFDLAPVRFSLDMSVGHLAALSIDDGGRHLAPLHRAPWAGEPDAMFPDGTAPNAKRLSGDFFCAPFGLNDVEPAPSHGWPANSGWDHQDTLCEAGRLTVVFKLRKTVMGAHLEKRLTLINGHPFVYQEHRFIGGEGAVSAAHHVMVHMKAGGQLAVSPKSRALTPPTALEPDPALGRSILRYPAETDRLEAFPLAAGGAADLKSYPPGEAHEDFITLVEHKGHALGWSVISRHAEQDRVLVLKQPEILPVTMLWMSNGGRDYAPWSGRHTGVLGIEDGRASPLGHADSIRNNALSAKGVATAFDLGEGGDVVIRQVIGACAIAPGEGAVVDITTGMDALHLQLEDGQSRRLPFDPSFLSP